MDLYTIIYFVSILFIIFSGFSIKNNLKNLAANYYFVFSIFLSLWFLLYFVFYLLNDTKYIFKGKYAWNSVIPADVTAATITLGINTAPDNTGSSVSTSDFSVSSTDLLHLYDASFEFTPITSGVYYFTVQSNAAILGALADLQISSTTATQKKYASYNLYTTISDDNVNLYGTNEGELIKVYNGNGQIMRQIYALSGSTSIELKSGVYFFKINEVVLKVVK